MKFTPEMVVFMYSNTMRICRAESLSELNTNRTRRERLLSWHFKKGRFSDEQISVMNEYFLDLELERKQFIEGKEQEVL